MTKKQLLEGNGITIRHDPGRGYVVKQERFSGATRANITVGTFDTRALAVEAAALAGIGYRSFDVEDWEAAK